MTECPRTGNGLDPSPMVSGHAAQVEIRSKKKAVHESWGYLCGKLATVEDFSLISAPFAEMPKFWAILQRLDFKRYILSTHQNIDNIEDFVTSA
ncbi:MAG: hypothetical protein OXH79_02710 [Boseongicola sp.]|nr:hypothetical protein [Boseongicola sp.]